MRRWLWLLLVGLILGSGLGAAWLYYFYDPSPPPPAQPVEGKGAAAGKIGGAIDQSAQTPSADKSFKVTMTIPGAKPSGAGRAGGTISGRIGSADQASGSTAGGGIDQSVASTTTEAAPVSTTTTEATPGQAVPATSGDQGAGGLISQPPARKTAVQPTPTDPTVELRKAIVVNDLTIPPPRSVPPFENREHPRFTLETLQKQRTVTIKGSTNLAVEGNGLMINVFRVYREADDEPERRAVLNSKTVPLYFQDQFQVDDQPWIKDLVARTSGMPQVFPKLASLDKNRVFVEILFTGRRDDALEVPGLSVYPIPGTDRQVYRIIRPIKMGLDRQSIGLLARAVETVTPDQTPAEPTAPVKPKVEAPPPVKQKQPPKPGGGGTSVDLKPLRYTALPRPRTAGLDFEEATFPNSRLPLILAGLSRPTGPVWGLTRISAPAPLNPADYREVF